MSIIFGTACLVIALVIAILCLPYPRPPGALRPRKTRLLSWRKVGFDYELTFNDGSVYRGNGTVWHRYPSGARAGTFTEGWLCDVWQRVRWEEQDAQADR